MWSFEKSFNFYELLSSGIKMEKKYSNFGILDA